MGCWGEEGGEGARRLREGKKGDVRKATGDDVELMACCGSVSRTGVKKDMTDYLSRT